MFKSEDHAEEFLRYWHGVKTDLAYDQHANKRPNSFHESNLYDFVELHEYCWKLEASSTSRDRSVSGMSRKKMSMMGDLDSAGGGGGDHGLAAEARFQKLEDTMKKEMVKTQKALLRSMTNMDPASRTSLMADADAGSDVASPASGVAAAAGKDSEGAIVPV